jgi:hypothetical protein
MRAQSGSDGWTREATVNRLEAGAQERHDAWRGVRCGGEGGGKAPVSAGGMGTRLHSSGTHTHTRGQQWPVTPPHGTQHSPCGPATQGRWDEISARTPPASLSDAVGTAMMAALLPWPLSDSVLRSLSTSSWAPNAWQCRPCGWRTVMVADEQMAPAGASSACARVSSRAVVFLLWCRWLWRHQHHRSGVDRANRAGGTRADRGVTVRVTCVQGLMTGRRATPDDHSRTCRSSLAAVKHTGGFARTHARVTARCNWRRQLPPPQLPTLHSPNLVCCSVHTGLFVARRWWYTRTGLARATHCPLATPAAAAGALHAPHASTPVNPAARGVAMRAHCCCCCCCTAMSSPPHWRSSGHPPGVRPAVCVGCGGVLGRRALHDLTRHRRKAAARAHVLYSDDTSQRTASRARQHTCSHAIRSCSAAVLISRRLAGGASPSSPGGTMPSADSGRGHLAGGAHSTTSDACTSP